jgi:hypothetical protein
MAFKYCLPLRIEAQEIDYRQGIEGGSFWLNTYISPVPES